jgi:hypothetical protein
MNVVVMILAAIGLLLLILLLIGFVCDKAPTAPPPEDAATPYREGLYAAIRMQRVAQDLEQQIHAEAAKHTDAQTKQSGSQVIERS